ncbi:hypothetical protein [uncultured Ruegeria sp.]|uniref:hypothetical protein n=1 Tax=uncultured Ruegeria sp. TaxID=259304 RepID=UPI0026330A0B|nr:hypothetical protein [uncultured Ruegeria sp.]
MTAAEIFSQLVLIPLRELQQDITKPLFILVDALDEGLGVHGGTSISDLLFALGTVPSNLKNIITSRDTGDLVQLSQRQGAKIADISNAETAIRDLINQELKLSKKSGAKDTTKAMIRRVRYV